MWAIIDPTRVTFLPLLDDGLCSIAYEHIVSLRGTSTVVTPANGSGQTIHDGEITDHVMTHYPDYAIALVSAGWREDPTARQLYADTVLSDDTETADLVLAAYLKRFW